MDSDRVERSRDFERFIAFIDAFVATAITLAVRVALLLCLSLRSYFPMLLLAGPSLLLPVGRRRRAATAST